MISDILYINILIVHIVVLLPLLITGHLNLFLLYCRASLPLTPVSLHILSYRPRRRWVGNIKMDLREMGWDGMDWIDLAQDRGQWRALVKTVMTLRVP
jgi:hypothetical protein